MMCGEGSSLLLTLDKQLDSTCFMSRPLRIEYPDAWYHVMNRGRRHERIFTSAADHTMFITLLQETIEQWNLRVSAYCLMPNHYHLFVQTPEGNLSRCMRHVDGVYTQRFNRAHRHDGSLFRGRYKSVLIDSNTYTLYLVRYIHRNPVRAGITDSPAGYKWSSHNGYVSQAKKWNWLHKQVVLKKFSRSTKDRIKNYTDFVLQADTKELLKQLESTRWPSIVGSKSFIEKIQSRFFSEEPDGEIPESRMLAPDITRIKKVVCETYGIDENALLNSKRGTYNEPRNVAIYLSRMLRYDTLNEIGSHFHIAKYSTVSTILEQMKKLLKSNRTVRIKVEKLKTTIINSQQQT